MDVKYLKNPHMTLPGVCFGKAKDGPRVMHPYDAPPEVFDLYCRTYNKEIAVKDYTPEQVAMMIDFYKEAIRLNPAWGVFEFDFKPTSEYRRLNDFYEDLARQNYRMSFRGVSEDYVRETVAAGDLYLFRITCQDMREAHHGKDGNFKVLLEEAFSERNRREDYIRLAGDAAVYYRKASLEKKVTHPAGVPIENKNPDNVRRTRTLPYDLYKDRRYMEDRYMLHLPVLIDPTASRYGGNAINARVQEAVRRNPGMYVLGINRGERSLVNIAVTAPDGTIVEQRNMNVFDGYDYRRRLTEREHERTDDRQNWNAVRDIKNLKAGYLSRVVGEIVRLQKKYGCIIAMERLDMEFKQGRQQFERNVYEQFERDIVNRFILLMDKEDPDRTRTALQLASPGRTVEDRTKYGQNGVILFVAPGWVTKTDPLTGFANRISTRYVNIPTCEKLMSTFDSFRYDPDKGRFVLTFRWGRVTPGRENGDPNRTWNVETAGTRFAERWTGSDGKEHKDYTVRLTYEMQKLLDKEGIPYKDGGNLIALFEGRGEAFWKKFLDILRLTLRNTDWNPETREFRIVSCTADASGRFYDSRTAKETMPKDADVLAAWNIARKAHMILRNIREYDPFDPPKDEKGKELPLRLSVRDEEWFAEVQG
jgi:CRISPR-associated protein Cpf1